MVYGSPRSLARWAGVFALLEGGTAVFGQLHVPRILRVSGDPAATAANILAHEPLFWAGFAVALIAVALHVVWVALIYLLLKPVSARLSLIAAFVGLVACSLQAFAVFFQVAPIAVVNGPRYLNSFTTEQLHALALLSLNLNVRAYNVYLVFFGLWCVLTGWLIFRSAFMPRLIGVLEMIAGLTWMTLLVPPLATSLGTITMIMAAPGELSLVLWLLIVGVNEEKWNEQASGAGARQQ